MNAGLGPYPEYRESGVAWLGAVPAHWEVRRLRAALTDCAGGVWGDEPNGRDDLACIRVADFDRPAMRVRLDRLTKRAIPPSERRRRLLRRGDLLLEKSGGGDLQSVGAVVLYDHEVPAVCSNFVARLPAAAGYDAPYLAYLFAHLYATGINKRSIKQTTGIQNIDTGSYLSEPVAFPPSGEQRAIALFLHAADRRIRHYVRAKQRLIALLEEQKRLVVHRAVTRGLDPDAPLKPSGVEWLGEVPAHWRVGHLRRFWDVIDCKHLTVPFTNEGVPLASVREVQRFELDLSTANRTTPEWFAQLVTGGRQPRRGDVVYCRNVSVGAAAYVTSDEPVAMGQDVCLLRSARESGRFLNHFLHSQAMEEQLQSIMVGSTFDRINISEIKSLVVAVPPVTEQGDIAQYLDRVLAAHVAAVRNLTGEIALAREYRTRLVADVVTGKLDVRAAIARLSNDSEEPDAPPLGGADTFDEDTADNAPDLTTAEA